MPPGQKFAQGLIEKYMKTAPIDFQVHRPPKMMDLTQAYGDGVHHFENDKVNRRRIQMLNLQNQDLNQIMAEAGAKKIGFLRSVEPNYIDGKKLETIDSLKVKTNEFDDRIMQK